MVLYYYPLTVVSAERIEAEGLLELFGEGESMSLSTAYREQLLREASHYMRK